jgi:hypothetical protein
MCRETESSLRTKIIPFINPAMTTLDGAWYGRVASFPRFPVCGTGKWQTFIGIFKFIRAEKLNSNKFIDHITNQ